MSLSRLLSPALALAAVALLTVGCTTSPASPAPTSTAGAPELPHTGDDVEAAWLDGGRLIAIVTWGSSTRTCQPTVTDAVADGQRVTLTLTDPDAAADGCDMNLAPRAAILAVPEGVDVTEDVDLQVTYGDVKADADLDGLDAAPQGPGEQQPSAGWFEDDGIVLLTYGSSSCPPVVESVDPADAGATVTFATTDRVCTMDFAPRATVITLAQEHDDDAPFTLTLVGDGLDAEVAVLD